MKGRGKKAAANKDAVEEEANVAENKEMKRRGKKAQPPAKKKKEDEMVAEPEVAEKKNREQNAHPSANSVSQVASEVDTPEAQAPQAVEATENSAAPEVKKGRGKAKAIFEELQEHKESENLVAAETSTKEKRVRGRQASSKDGTEKPAKTSKEPLPNDQIESSLPAVPVVETKEKRGRGRQAKTPVEAPIEASIEAQEAAPAKRGRGKKAAVSIVDSEEEAGEEVEETKGKKRVAVAKKQFEVANKSAVLEEVAAPAEVMETIESPETVPANKSRGKKASGKKDAAVEEAVFSAEPEVAEKKGRGKKAHPSADSASQVASEVDIPDAMAGAGLSTSGGDVASSDDHATAPYRSSQKMSTSDQTVIKAFEKIRTMADRMNLGRNIVDRANALFKQVHNGKHLKGHSTNVSAATCLHIACRQEKAPRTFKEICDVSNLGVKEIGNVFNLIRVALKITLDPITTEDFIPRFCSNLVGLPNNIQMAASHIARKAVELDIVPGRCPISVAAVAIYMASHALGMELTKKKLCEVAGVADVTIRESYKLMYPRSAALFPENVELDMSLLPQPSKLQ